MPEYRLTAVRRAMKIQEVILRAMSGELTWIRAAEVIGITARSMRRWKQRYEREGYDGLLDRRCGLPSPKRAPVEEVERILRLYREKYLGFNVRHFYGIARREHEVWLSYSYVKQALQGAGLVGKGRRRGRHFMKRERRGCFGELLHLDGSPHAWLALRPEEKQTMLAIVDDATSRLLYAQLWPGETSAAVMTALREVVELYGIPMNLYTDRAGWAFYTPQAGGKVDKEKLTQVGRMLARLGVEHIPAYSPQARGRSERLNRTLQDRLVNELRVAGVRSVAAANRYLRERFIGAHNEEFSRAPREVANVFVSVGPTDLEQVFCHEEQRVVRQDNTVVLEGVRLQLTKQPGLATCAGKTVKVRRHLDGHHTVWLGQRLLGEYDARGRSRGLSARGGNSASGYALSSVAA
jgi:transposase